MSHPAAPYATTVPAGQLPFSPLYTLPSLELQATWSEARLGQECGLWLQAFNRPAYDCFFHIPNGGLRTAVESVGFKAQHAKRGVPDYFLAVPCFSSATGISRFQYCGLFIELKTATGRVAPEQALWHARLRAQGYRVEVIRSLPEFIALLTDYLS
jgi:hypothetical protein